MARFARLALVASGFAALGVAYVTVANARREIAFYKAQRWPVPKPSGEAWLDPALDVDLVTSTGGRARGWLLPSRNGAGVVLVTGAGSDRRQLSAEAKILSQAGFGVVLFDPMGHGESDGPRWQGGEQQTLVAAIDVLVSRGATDAARVGAFGFSIGAALVADTATREPRIRSVVLAGCLTRWVDQSRYEHGRWGIVTSLPAIWVDRYYTGTNEPLDPVTSIPRIAPRPILLVTGDMDSVVPPGSADVLYAVASEPKELLVIPGAAHGSYVSVAPDSYPQHLVAFFERTLAAAGGGAR